MKQLALTVENRSGKGRNEMRRLRSSGKIPAVLYGKSGSRSLSVTDTNFRELLRSVSGVAALIELTDEKGDKSLSVLHDTQRDPCTDKFLHADFHEVSMDHEMQFSLPVSVTGESDGVKNYNGTLEIHHHELHIKCLPKDLPNNIEIDVTELGLGESVYLKDIKLPQGVNTVGDPDEVVVLCAAPASSVAEEETAAEESAEEAPAEAVAAES